MMLHNPFEKLNQENQVRIINISDYPQAIEVISEWHYLEWGYLYPSETRDSFREELRQCLSTKVIPSTFIAIENNMIVGSISLLAKDMDVEINATWTPWLANLFVHPKYRNKGIGKKLIHHLVEYAMHQGIKELFLFTQWNKDFYERLGWSVIHKKNYNGEQVDIMKLCVLDFLNTNLSKAVKNKD